MSLWQAVYRQHLYRLPAMNPCLLGRHSLGSAAKLPALVKFQFLTNSEIVARQGRHRFPRMIEADIFQWVVHQIAN